MNNVPESRVILYNPEITESDLNAIENEWLWEEVEYYKVKVEWLENSLILNEEKLRNQFEEWLW